MVFLWRFTQFWCEIFAAIYALFPPIFLSDPGIPGVRSMGPSLSKGLC